MGGPGRGVAAVAAGLALLGFALFPGAVRAERAQVGNVIVSLNGGLSPKKLPRSRRVPVAVHLSGSIGTADGSPLPRLTRLELGLAGPGTLFTRGLPSCHGGRLRNADSHQALRRCGRALVGVGHLEALVVIPGQGPFAIRAHLLAFNGHTMGGRRAIWVHAFSYQPPISLAVPFEVIQRHGSFSVALIAAVEPAIGVYPHLARFEMTLSRRFAYRGQWRSYLMASCPIPNPFTAGFLAFAQATYTFAEDDPVEVESVRSCRAG
jgi:hypothetical protein